MIIGIIFAVILGIYFYFLALFLEKNFLWVLPVLAYLAFFVVRDFKEEEEDLEKSLLRRKGEMKFDWRVN